MSDGSVINQGTLVRGNVHGEGSIEIYGRVDGDVIVTGDVTLGENGSIRGNVSGVRLTISGQVAGDLRGTEAIVLEATAQVNGDLTAPRVGIEEGARARGALRTEEPSAPAAIRSEGRRAPRPAEAPRRLEAQQQERPVAEAPRQAAPAAPRAVAPAPRPAPAPAERAPRPSEPPAQKRQPPAPVVPALRGASARKKKARGH